MDEKRLEEIEKRAAKDAYSWTEAEKLLQDIPDLLAEVHSRGLEVDACHAIMTNWMEMRNRIMHFPPDDNTLSSQAIEEVEAEVKRLRGLLRDIDAEIHIPPHVGIKAKIKEVLDV